MANSRSLLSRYTWFVVGVIIAAFGTAVVTKGALGTTPITSTPLVLSLEFSPSIGAFTFVLNMLFIVGQALLLRDRFPAVQWLQIVVNILFSLAIDLSMWSLSWLNPTEFWLQLVIVIGGCVVLGFGIALEVAPGVLVVPGEGMVRAIAIVSKVRFGTVKIVFDSTLVATAVALSSIFFGTLQDVGLGTLISAFLIGICVNVFFSRIPWLTRLAPPNNLDL